jgi:hypothetical protein
MLPSFRVSRSRATRATAAANRNRSPLSKLGQACATTSNHPADRWQQLDWCVGYLHGIQKAKISTQLARNRHTSGEPAAAAR